MKISSLPLLPTPTGAESLPVVSEGQTRRTTLGGLMSSVAMPFVNRAETAATRAEGFALALETTTAGGWYSSLEAGAAAVAEGEGFFVNDGVNFYTGQKIDGVGVRMAAFNTTRALKQMVSEGLPILSMGTESAVTSEAGDYIREFGDLCRQFGGGTLKFPGKGYVFQCGGDPVTEGEWNYILSGQTQQQAMPFNRGLIEIQNNMRLIGQGAKLLLAPGYTCPPALFYNPFWTGVAKSGFHVEGLDFDGNQANQIILPVNANPTLPPWLHGNGITHIGVSDVSARRCIFRNWRGMGLGGGPAPDMGLSGDNYLAEHCEFVDNFNGSIQWNGRRLRTLYNHHHGSGGWTAFVDIEVEAEAAGYDMLDVWSIGEIFDGRDGVAPPESFLEGVNGSPGYASDSAAAAAMNLHFRRGYCLSGNYSTANTNADADGNLIFNGQKGRISVVHSKHWQTNISTGGCDRVHIDSPMIEMTYEANARFMYPQDLNAISAAPANNGNNNVGLTEFKVSNATIRNDMVSCGLFAGGYEWVDFTGTITGGRNAAIRLENCGGKIDARIKNVGGTDDDGADSVGNKTSGITTYGNKGPLDIRLHVMDDRGAGAKMKYAAYINSGTGHMINVDIMSAEGMLVGSVNDINNSCAIQDRSTLRPSTNRPVVLGNGLEVHGKTSLISDDGDLSLDMKSPEGTTRRINFYTGEVFQAQMLHTADGTLQTLLVDASGNTIVTMQLRKSGVVGVSASWKNPLQALDGPYLWATSTGIWRTSTILPTAEGDGVALGAQS